MGTSTTGSVPVRLYLRPPLEGRHSIERVVRTVVANLPSDIDAEVVTLSNPARGLVGRVRALGEALTRAPGVHHVTGDVHFLVLALPPRRTLLTVHDLVRLEELHGVRRWLYRLLWFSLPLRRAVAVTVISEKTGKDLLAEFPYVAPKLHVIPNPLPTGLGPRKRLDSGLVPTILHVGTKANKNLHLSVMVAQRLQAELWILGQLHSQQSVTLRDAGIMYRVHSDVPDESLVDIYGSADVLLFPSFAEGFGMPIIEAQACGLPVVTSDREPMRTVAGNAALLVDPLDVNAAVEAVSRVFQSPTVRDQLIEAGYSNAANYSPTRIASAYARLYRERSSMPE